VDYSDAVYIKARVEFLESHQRQLVDVSDPTSETKRPCACKSELSFMGNSSVDHYVGSETSTNCRWWDSRNSTRAFM
jgi:hypothetical protein